MSAWAVRTATREDAETAVAVLRAAIIETGAADHRGDPVAIAEWLGNKTSEHFCRWLEDEDTWIVVAEWNGALCGVGAMRRGGSLDLCYVHPRSQRSGAGRALMRALEEQARAWGVMALELTSTVTARDFYRRLGYELREEGVTTGDIRMVKRLD